MFWGDDQRLSEAEMVRSTCLELGQADLKAIGRARGFDSGTVASRALLEHVFLSEQGVAAAMALLTPAEINGLHLLNCLRGGVNVEFFRRVYPNFAGTNSYGSYNDRFKAVLQQVKTQLIQRGLLVFGTLPEGYPRDLTILERRRFRFPEPFARYLPLPFQTHRSDPTRTVGHVRDVRREKVLEILKLRSGTVDKQSKPSERWRLERGELFLGTQSTAFRVEHLEEWQRDRFTGAVDYTNEQLAQALHPVPVLYYALSRLGEGEWLAPQDLMPLWTMALPAAQMPDPQSVCAAGYKWGCLEKAELDSGPCYRLASTVDEETATPCEAYLDVGDPAEVRLRLERTPLIALERLVEVSRLRLDTDGLTPAPDLLKLSHARPETLADPIIAWLRERHQAFRSVLEKIEQHRGKLIVHENVLVARVSDLALKVMLEKRFGGPGQLVGLTDEFVAFPTGLTSEIQSWLKKSGHVVKSIQSGEPVPAEAASEPDEEPDE